MEKNGKTYKLISSKEALDTILTDGKRHDFAIALNFGAYSRKTIKIDKKKKETYVIHNHIDDSTQKLTWEEIMNDSITHIGTAIKQNAFALLP